MIFSLHHEAVFLHTQKYTKIAIIRISMHVKNENRNFDYTFQSFQYKFNLV